MAWALHIVYFLMTMGNGGWIGQRNLIQAPEGKCLWGGGGVGRRPGSLVEKVEK